MVARALGRGAAAATGLEDVNRHASRLEQSPAAAGANGGTGYERITAVCEVALCEVRGGSNSTPSSRFRS